jgi:predicted transcriptional regulator
MRLKDNLRELINSHGITVAHLSRTTKIPLQTLHGWLGGVEPSISIRNMSAKKDGSMFYISPSF